MLRLQKALDHVYMDGAPAIFIDDSGIFGTAIQSTSLKEKIFSAVVAPPTCAAEVLHETFEISDELKKICKESLQAPEVKEFHFCDIFHGKKEFKSLPLESRIGMFEFMAAFVEHYPLEIVTVGWPETRNRKLVHDLASLVSSKRLGPFDFENLELSAFLLLIFKLRNFVKNKNWEMLPSVFCDQGLYRHGRVLIGNIPLLQNFHRMAVFFVDSAKVPAIQIADFTAFLLSRHKGVLQKWRKNKNLNRMDNTVLRLMILLYSKYIK